ncbi:MAG TPA: T9SS type A sorting domain-containing protein [Lutibacter sp.]|nr:T9SS type A sorting domain-containing protein [Lutibacter sp.]
MKNIAFIFFFVLLLPLYSLAQDYEPMLQEGSFWDVCSMDHDTGCYQYPRRFYLDEEIEFNGNTYYKLRKHQIVNSEGGAINCFGPPGSEYTFVETTFTYSNVYIREDIIEKKVYVWAVEPWNGGTSYQEFILYDFTLEIGDILPANTYSHFYSGSDMVVTQVYYDADNRKTIWLESDGGGYYYEYTEGVGGTSGIISPVLEIFEAPDWLYCHGNAENQNECSGYLGTNDFIEKSFNIYPNPVQKTLFVESENSSSLELFNILGKQIYSNKNKKKYSIDMSNYTEGFYLLKVTDMVDGYVKTFKIVVE